MVLMLSKIVLKVRSVSTIFREIRKWPTDEIFQFWKYIQNSFIFEEHFLSFIIEKIVIYVKIVATDHPKLHDTLIRWS